MKMVYLYSTILTVYSSACSLQNCVLAVPQNVFTFVPSFIFTSINPLNRQVHYGIRLCMRRKFVANHKLLWCLLKYCFYTSLCRFIHSCVFI